MTSRACSRTRRAAPSPRRRTASRRSSAPCRAPCGTSCASSRRRRWHPAMSSITNDPWMGTGHLPGHLCRQAGVPRRQSPRVRREHRARAGHRRPHPSPEAREIFEEGLQIPIMKLVSAGRPDETLLKILARNVRTPELTGGDLWAQVTALGLMESRLVGLAREYGSEVAGDASGGDPGPDRGGCEARCAPSLTAATRRRSAAAWMRGASSSR